MNSRLIILFAIIAVVAILHALFREPNTMETFSGKQEYTPAPFIPLECPAFPHYYNTICKQSVLRQNTCSPPFQPSVQPCYSTCGNSLVQPNCNSTQVIPSPIGCHPATQFAQTTQPLGCVGRCLLYRHYT